MIWNIYPSGTETYKQLRCQKICVYTQTKQVDRHVCQILLFTLQVWRCCGSSILVRWFCWWNPLRINFLASGRVWNRNRSLLLSQRLALYNMSVVQLFIFKKKKQNVPSECETATPQIKQPTEEDYSAKSEL